ncbi:MAG: hypothetical protein H3Z51_01570, partial [archaeon]|nr:hypothetical protein [archaeon]
YNPFFEKAGMMKIDAPKSHDDLAYEQALQRLEGMGFNLDLLGSKAHNLTVTSHLEPNQLQELRSILRKHFFCKKFHVNARLQEAIEKVDQEAMAEGLKHRRLKPIYLIWKTPNFKGHPEIEV